MVAKLFVGAVVCTCLIGTLTLAQSANNDEQKASSETTSNEAKLKSLRQERLQLCESYVEALDAAFVTGQITAYAREDAAEELFEARLEMATDPQVAAIYRREIERLAEVENRLQLRYKGGTGGYSDVLMVKLKQLKLEIELAKLEAANE